MSNEDSLAVPDHSRDCLLVVRQWSGSGGRGAVVGRGKEGFGDGNYDRSEVDGLGKLSLNFAGRSTVADIRLLVVHYADRAVVMIGAVIVVMERCHQSGKENEAYEKK
jgi:hypothetical protein